MDKELHKRNAPRILQVMLDLGGLYIKLGQVLSVTALPIPDEYRGLFRTLQSSVPGHAEFETIVKPTLEKEFGRPLGEIFSSIDEIPCGAASIGQAHRAVLKESGEEVVIKVQYPNARWQVPADISCVGDFLKLCIYFNLVDEDLSKLSYEEFSRQFLAELEYDQERSNLEQVYTSALDPNAPYIQRGVIVPKVYPELCTNLVITMSYLPGPKFEEEAKRQLEMVGIRTNRSIRDVVGEATRDAPDVAVTSEDGTEANTRPSFPNNTATKWGNLSRLVGKWIGVDAAFSVLRLARKLYLWSQLAAVSSIQLASTLSLAPSSWENWAREHRNVSEQMARLDWTHDAIYALLDVHGYQILNQGLFNADPHPGNLLIVQDLKTLANGDQPKIGLIDFGQCKKLTEEERVKVARLLLSVADNAPDDMVATRFRELGIQTKNDSTRFLADFARLMFGSFKPEHLDHAWHRELHKEDRVTYFPTELSMVYRTSLLLRGLAMSLQLNVAVGEQWRHHAANAIESQSQTIMASSPRGRQEA
jgi:aarF domain-containing kinase